MLYVLVLAYFVHLEHPEKHNPLIASAITKMASKSGEDAAATARNNMEAARVEVMDCEKKIQSIKEALKGVDSAGGSQELNSLKITALKVRSFIQTHVVTFIFIFRNMNF